jgi:hypothetical protein
LYLQKFWAVPTNEVLPPSPLPFYVRTIHAVIFSHVHRVSIIAQVDHFLAFRAAGGLKFGWIFKLLKIVFIRSIVNINLGFKIIAAFLAGFPITRMSLVEVMAA